jgi:multidrug efflux pump subunit AcrB
LCNEIPTVNEAVLNFKDGSTTTYYTPNRGALQNAGVQFSLLGNSLRYGVYGPVTYKRIDKKGETDVRIYSTQNMYPSVEDIKTLMIKPQNSKSINPISIHSIADNYKNSEVSTIQRYNRRRSASVSIRTDNVNIEKLKKIVMTNLLKLNLPKGYSIIFDTEAMKRVSQLKEMALYFIAAIIFCYMIISISSQSFLIPLAILTVVPVSMSVPALFITLSGIPINSACSCAFIVVCGMAVNATVLVTENIREAINPNGYILNFKKALIIIKNRIPTLFATSATTIIAVLPFIILRDGNGLARILSIVSALGVSASCIFSITLLPSLASLFPRMFCRFQTNGIKNIY